MHVIYIAGPYRADNVWEIEQNIRRAEALALEVARIGAMPLCPHTLTRFYYGTVSEEFWLEGTAELLCRCDAVLLTRFWSASDGTRHEMARARDRQIPVFFELTDLRDWLWALESGLL